MHTDQDAPPLHGHDFVELVYVIEGEGEHVCDGESYQLFAGDVFIINPDEQHAYHIAANQKIEIFNCLFTPSLFDEDLLRGLGITHSMDYFYVHPFLDNSERFHRCINLRGEAAVDIQSMFVKMSNEYEARQNGYETIIRLQLVQLLIQLSRIYAHGDTTLSLNRKELERKTFIKRVAGYLERHYDQKLTLANLSSLFNMSSRHLNRIFKEETGKTVVEYIHHIRISRAKKLLTESDAKIIAVALDVGYDDPAFFTRLFTRKVGCPPGRYREKSGMEPSRIEIHPS